MDILLLNIFKCGWFLPPSPQWLLQHKIRLLSSGYQALCALAPACLSSLVTHSLSLPDHTHNCIPWGPMDGFSKPQFPCLYTPAPLSNRGEGLAWGLACTQLSSFFLHGCLLMGPYALPISALTLASVPHPADSRHAVWICWVQDSRLLSLEVRDSSNSSARNGTGSPETENGRWEIAQQTSSEPRTLSQPGPGAGVPFPGTLFALMVKFMAVHVI